MFVLKDGIIVYKVNGNILVCKKGDGSLFVLGWIDEYEWEGYILFD